MAKNTGKGFRKGEVKSRSQTLNPKTSTWTKRSSSTGQFMSGKEGGSPYKGVRKDK